MFYAKLAFGNIRKNGKYYYPYILTCIFTIAMYYIMCFVAFNQGLDELRGAEMLKSIMDFGSYIVAIFSFIFLIYANSFLMKQRKREFGLYNILGLEKRHIGRIMFFESLYITCFTLLIGIISGVLFGRLVLLIFGKVLAFKIKIGFSISGLGITRSLILFLIIFTLILMGNLRTIKKTNPIELLNSQAAGEREPKGKFLITLLGIVTLFIGYTIALRVESPMDALTMFFVAVILVVIGTYCIFISGSITFLKILRKNKKYYYQTSHFTAVSGMLYRMKKNAAGLASICILSTMVLVVISTTTSLFIGVEDAFEYRYPYDFCIEKEYNQENIGMKTEENKKLSEAFMDIAAKNGREVKEVTQYETINAFFRKEKEGFVYANKYSYGNDIYLFEIYSAQDYKSIGGDRTYELAENEVVIYGGDYKKGDTIKIGSLEFIVADTLEKFSVEDDFGGYWKNIISILADSSVLEKIYLDEVAAVGVDKASTVKYFVNADTDGTEEEKLELYEQVKNLGTYIECRQQTKDDFYMSNGSLLFLGIFLGLLFLIITVLIIYYKQITEGYEDRKRFEIMQKVGMGEHEVKRSIKSQILTVFMLPIIAAACHVAGAFKMITKLLALFNLTNVHLFTVCTICTILVFAIVYAFVYWLTSKVYYGIIKS